MLNLFPIPIPLVGTFAFTPKAQVNASDGVLNLMAIGWH
jgi:hypothetical protein